MPQAELAIGRIARVAALLVLAIVGAVLVATFLRQVLHVPVSGDGVQPRASLAVGAAPLLSAPQPERERVRDAKLKQLHGSGWVDAAHGVAHIPIEAAIELLAPADAASEASR